MPTPTPSVAKPSFPSTGARGMALALLLSINLFNYIDRYVLAAVVPEIQQQFFRANAHNAEFWMGTLATAFMVSYMLMAPVFGFLADRGSRWLIVGVSVLLWSLATGASGLSAMFGGFVLLFITRLFVGVGEAGYGPAAPTLLSDYFSLEHRGIVLSCFYLAIPVGSALGFAIGGIIAKRYGWPSAFYAVVAPGLVMGVLCFLMRDPPRGHGGSGAEPSHGHSVLSHLADYKVLLKNPSYVINCAGMTAMTFAIGGISFWMPKILVMRGAGDLEKVNYTFGAITAGAGFVATLVGGLVGDLVRKWIPSAYFFVSGIAILASAPFVILIMRAPFPLAWVYVGIAVFLLFFNTGPTNTALANVTPPSIRATAFAVNILIIHALGDAVAPPLLGAIGHYSWPAAFNVVAGAIVLAGVLWLYGCKNLARDTAAAEAAAG